MHRYQSNKQAFIIAALVILLCLVCLTGATYALFTSNPSGGTIGIITAAGTVKVDIVDAVDETTSLVGGVLQFQTTAAQKEVLFEPGATFYTQGFKIKNLGNVPINFRLSISEEEKIDLENGQTISTEDFLDIFEVWISTDPTDPTNAQKLTEFTGRLETADGKDVSECTYHLVIKMKETVGNDFQGKTYSGIGVTVYAVQGNVDA